MTTAEFFATTAHRMRAYHEAEAARQRQDIADRITAKAIALLGEYAETVQSKSKLIEINAVRRALGAVDAPAYDPTRMTMGDTP